MTIEDLNKQQGKAFDQFRETAKWLAEEYCKQSEYQVGDIIIDTQPKQRYGSFDNYYNRGKVITEYVFGGFDIDKFSYYQIKTCLLKLKEEDKEGRPFKGYVVKIEELGKRYKKKVK